MQFAGTASLAGLLLWGLLIVIGPPPANGYLAVIHCMHQHVFHAQGGGRSSNKRIDLRRIQLQAGDVLVCHVPDAAYGHYTHVTMYLGEGQVYNCNPREGFYLHPLHWLSRYDYALVLRPGTTATARQVAGWVRSQLERPFFIGADRQDPHLATCVTLAWQGWYRHHPELPVAAGAMSPDQLVDEWQHLVLAEIPGRP